MKIGITFKTKKPEKAMTMQVKSLLIKVLLLCGIISSVLYIGADILASMQWEEYSYTSRSVSELMAIEAPTRPFLILLFSIYNALVIAFGFGILIIDKHKRNTIVTGIILIIYGLVGYIGLYFFPMHLPGIEQSMTPTDTMHLVVTSIIVLLIMLSIVFGARLDGNWFRIYSILTIPILVLFGFLAGIDGSKLAAQLPTPWLGIKERINIYAYLIWVFVLSIVMLRMVKQANNNSSI